jgi:rubrerythrin
MTLNPRESTCIQDLIKQEGLCAEKYDKAANEACDPSLKTMLSALADNERQHRETLSQMACGTVPDVGKQGHSHQRIQPAVSSVKDSAGRQCDQFLCEDLLAAEKQASSLYDASIFEFCDQGACTVLNHMQKEEQEHGRLLHSYMEKNGMCS